MAFLASFLPSILGAAASAAKKTTVGKSILGGGTRRRRRRARLTPSEMAELSQIRAVLGRTAAANALPFYLGRGR